jgi:SAM-dependent methyltransferase
MGEADRKRLDHVVLPRRLPGLALLERYFPPPADNLLDAELTAFAQAGDTVLDPWAGTGWTVRRALAHGMRVVAADPSPLAQLAAQAFLFAPDAAAIDAALAQLAASRRVDVPLRQHIEELYATRCATCRRPVVGEQYIWPRDASSPRRKIYRCANCDLATAGAAAIERVADVDEVDLAKLGIDVASATPDSAGTAAVVDLTDAVMAEDPDAPLGEPGEPPAPVALEPEPPLSAGPAGPRWASTVHPRPMPADAGDVRHGLHYQQLHDRFPVLDGRDELVDEILRLYTPRNLYALQTIANKIDAEFGDRPMANVMRLALAACLLPASRLNGYPGRVASLRIGNGHVRQPASRNQREINVWHEFARAVDEVKLALAPYAAQHAAVRFAAEFDELGGISAANVFWVRSRPAVVGQYLRAESVDLVLAASGPPAGPDELSFEYLATGWLMGREAAETLRLEPLFGAATGGDGGASGTALRHAVASASRALKPGGWFSVLIDGDETDRMLTVALAAAAAGLELVDVVVRESRSSGDGITLHCRKPAAEDRLREAIQPRPLRLGADGERLTYPELAEAIERAAVGLLRDRGEPAGLTRLAAASLVELQRTGLLRRLAAGRHEALERPGEATGSADEAGRSLLTTLIVEELWRTDHPSLVAVGDGERAAWWLREPQLADSPLADRVEWATFSLLSTAGRLDEASFMERVYDLFPGLAAPDEELVRACLSAYASMREDGRLRTEDELTRRQAEHTRMIALLAAYGHRLGLRVWISKREQSRSYADGTLLNALRDDERRTYLPLVVRAPAEALGAVDVIWYRRGRLAFLFEVEWTAMVGEAVLRRGRQIEPTDQQARFLVLPAERSELLRVKLERSPWLHGEMERQNWHVLKWPHLETLVDRPGASLDWLEPMLGLDPLIERGGEQLTMFGE